MVSLATPRARPLLKARVPARVRMSGPGVALFICTLLLGASAFPSVRPRIFGMLVHPFTLAVAVLFPLGLGQLRRFPRGAGVALALFASVFTISSLIGPSGGVNFAVKTIASAVTVVVGATCVRNDKDLRAVVVAFALAAALISVRGLFVVGAVGVHGINPMDGIANKNGFSLFALPALLLASHVAFRTDTPRGVRMVLLGCCVFVVFAIFSTGNRSGWLGVILIAATVALRAVRRPRTLALLIVTALTASALVMVYGDKLVIENRMAKTSAESPNLRADLALSAMRVGLDYPVLGSSPQNLPREMSRGRGGVRGYAYDSHNVTGLLIGGTGGLGFLSFVAFGWAVGRRPRGFSRRATPGQREAHYLLRAMLFLWVVRGQFTAEILYSPSFSLAIGVCIACCIVTGVWAPARRAAALVQRPHSA